MYSSMRNGSSVTVMSVPTSRFLKASKLFVGKLDSKMFDGMVKIPNYPGDITDISANTCALVITSSVQSHTRCLQFSRCNR